MKLAYNICIIMFIIKILYHTYLSKRGGRFYVAFIDFLARLILFLTHIYGIVFYKMVYTDGSLLPAHCTPVFGHVSRCLKVSLSCSGAQSEPDRAV